MDNPVKLTSKYCPWCGKPLGDTLTECGKCGWTRSGKHGTSAAFAFAGFLLLSLILMVVTLFFVGRSVKDLDRERSSPIPSKASNAPSSRP